MTQYERELSNLSYTNKDFGTIYPELLDLAKKISYKWDPTTSDESDPGVVLLKLCALMADKNNYNIDKNILELFPLSVTQDPSAREIFDQCGYTMKYYRSATTTINITMIQEPDQVSTDASSIRNYIIPLFTMVSDANNEIVYTITPDPNDELNTNTITSDGRAYTFFVTEGKVQDYEIDGEYLITSANLDYNNRLYFSYLDIPENGIYISTDNKDWNQWKRVDNLTIQPLGTTCYKFGLSHDGSSCYIEFPNDIDNLIGSGLYIKYLRTSGVNGNIGYRRLHQFYTELETSYYIDNDTTSNSCKLTNDNVTIINTAAATNGSNPESIDSAYRNYQKTKGTFDTLVSLNDYTNFIYTNKLVSNGYVCDRTNDPQVSYTIHEETPTYSREHVVVEKDENKNDKLSAFDLRLYGLKYVDDPTSALTGSFDSSFELIPQNDSITTDYFWITEAMKDVKCIQHNFKKPEYNIPLMYKNKFTLDVTIMPQYSLTAVQKSEVITAVRNALCKVLYSRSIDFGEEANFDLIYETIQEADPRVKSISLQAPSYQTYAVYIEEVKDANGYSSGTIKELRIDYESKEPEKESDKQLWKTFRENIVAKSILAGRTPLFVSDSNFSYPFLQTEPKFGSVDYLSTNADAVLNFSDSNTISTYEIKDNENILLTSPNLITDRQYGGYVKYLYNLKRPVSKNEDYMLSDNEFIVFFWKAEDTDEFYTYYKYDSTSNSNVKIINSTVKLETTNIDKDTIKGKVENLISGKGKVGDTDLNNYITDLTKNFWVLSGTNTITTKKPNTVTITSDTEATNIFWILNLPSEVEGTEKPQAVLFNKNETEYTLKSGEYLLYTNTSRTQLISLGTGTIIKRDNSLADEVWSVDSITYDTLVANEYLSYLNGELGEDPLWFTLEKGKKLTCTETQYYQLGPKTIFKLSYTGTENNPKSIKINSTGMYVDGELRTDTSDFQFSYIDSESTDATEVVLPTKNSSETCWQVKTLLNIDVSPTKAMTLLDNQSITYEKSEDSTKTTKELRNCTFYTSKEVNTVGGEKVDVRYYDLSSNNYKSIELYSFKYPDLTSADNWITRDLNNYVITLNPDSSSLISTAEFTLTKGSYILPIVIDGDVTVSSIELVDSTNNSNKITFKDPDEKANFKLGTHYINLVIAKDIKYNLQITYTNTTGKDVTIKFKNLYKYTTDNTIYSSNYKYFDVSELMKKTYEMDEKHYFDYTYQVPDELLIENPLEAVSFFKQAHIYNKFTIAQWDKENANTKFTILNKIR